MGEGGQVKQSPFSQIDQPIPSIIMLAIKQSVGKMAPFTRMAVARFSNTVTLSADDKPKVVVADITDSIEWWYVAPIFNGKQLLFFVFRT